MQASPPASWYMHWHWHLPYLPSIPDIKIGSSGYLISIQSFFDYHSPINHTIQQNAYSTTMRIELRIHVPTLTFLQDTKCQIKNIIQ